MARVVLENVRVDLPIYGTQRNLRKVLFDRATGGLIEREGRNQDRVVVKALADVSMTLKDGDRLGLIGHNGAGKSTLLKVLAGIYEPIEGSLLVDGRVTPLFDMMPGLDPEDSGYENVFTSGLLLGLSREEVEQRLPRIEEFSELGEYLALPVRTYSAGMQMRLGFALVTNLDPDILLMDEGISAGDARFVERAERRLAEFVGRSRILVVASHSTKLIRSICNKAALMAGGRVLAIGPVEDMFDEYDAIIHGVPRGRAAPVGQSTGSDESAGGTSNERKIASVGTKEEVIQEYLKRATGVGTKDVWAKADFAPINPLGNDIVQCVGGSIETLGGVPCEHPDIHLPFRVCLRYRLLQDSPHKMVPNFHFYDEHQRHLFVSTPAELPRTDTGDYVAYCVIDPFVFNVGRFSVSLALSSMDIEQPVHFEAHDALRFQVEEPPGVDPRRHGYAAEIPGVTRLRLKWQIVKAR